MGNGPSLTTFLEKNTAAAAGKHVFAVNFFCNTEYFEKIKPSFYVLLDPNIFSTPLKTALKDNVEELIERFKKISWEMYLFVPYKFKKSLFTQQLNNKNIKIVPFNSTPVQGYSFLENWLFKRNLGMPRPQTVINAAIFLALNMEFKVIHLFGVEQSWLKYLSINDDNSISVGLSHFYKDSDKTGENRTLSEFLTSQATVFKSHMRLQRYSERNEQLILNHTSGSYIDAYKRTNQFL
ncbi:hypothetical protein NT017_05210 [Prolixibacter sp. NT017]|nr:hypothetical protein NT017_05210 [Prolixibacter sp. NT017]